MLSRFQFLPALKPALQKNAQRLARLTSLINPDPINRQTGWLLAGVGLVLLWVWIWQWVLSLTIGLGVMVVTYLSQQRQLKLNWTGWPKLWKRTNRSLTLSGLAGIVALGSTYLATAVWQESDQHWLATLVLLEGLGILGILTILSFGLWQRANRSNPQSEERDSPEVWSHQVWLHQFSSQWLTDLSHPDPLKRLLAVRQTTHAQLSAAGLPAAGLPLTSAQLVDCFRLMLDRETDALVCQALMESMQALHPKPLPSTQVSSPPLSPLSPLSTVALATADQIPKQTQEFQTVNREPEPAH